MLYVIALSMLKLSLCPLICSVISVLKSKAAGGDRIMSLQEFAEEPNSKVIYYHAVSAALTMVQ